MPAPDQVGGPGTIARVSRRRPFTVSASLSHRLNLVALALVALIVVTGGAVRLTGSGLGCSDWPECSVGHLTPALQFHGLVEFGNRMVTVVLVIAVAARLPGRHLPRAPAPGPGLAERRPGGRRCWPRRCMGGIVVYTKLNPYLVMVHFFATMVLLANAVVLVHRSTRDYSPGSAHLLVPRPLLRLHYGVLALLAVVIAAGTAATGAGPLAGDSQGQEVAKRIPIAFRDLAELHAVPGHAPGRPDRRPGRRAPHGRRPRAGAPGGADPPRPSWWPRPPSATPSTSRTCPPLLVEVHLLGATVLVVGAVQCFLACTFHAPEVVPVPAAEPPAEAGVPIGAR